MRMKIVGGPTVAPCKLSTSRGGPLLPLRTRSFRAVPVSHHRRWPHPSCPASQNKFSRFYFQISDCVIGNPLIAEPRLVVFDHQKVHFAFLLVAQVAQIEVAKPKIRTALDCREQKASDQGFRARPVVRQ